MPTSRTTPAKLLQCSFGVMLDPGDPRRCTRPAAYRSPRDKTLHWCAHHAAHLGPSTLIKLKTPASKP